MALSTVTWKYLFLGPHRAEGELELDDIKLLRIARQIHPDSLMELSANLVGNVQFLGKIEQQYRGFSPSDYAFMILHDWKKSIKNKRETPTAARLLEIFNDIRIDKHYLCQVYNMTVILFTWRNPFNNWSLHSYKLSHELSIDSSGKYQRSYNLLNYVILSGTALRTQQL